MAQDILGNWKGFSPRLRSAAVADLWEARLRAEMGNARRAVCGDRFVASRSIYELGGEDYDLHALDGIRMRAQPVDGVGREDGEAAAPDHFFELGNLALGHGRPRRDDGKRGGTR